MDTNVDLEQTSKIEKKPLDIRYEDVLQKLMTTERIQPAEIKFTGSAKEYFQIWIVNTLLTIITLGVYSAWAKVRTKKYLYRHTELAGASFDYHADPVRILYGRIIVAFFAIGYYLSGQFSLYLPVAFILGFLILFPWIIVKGMRFDLRNTSYRNIRFNFSGMVSASYNNYIPGYILTLFSFGLAWPYLLYRHTCFKKNHTQFGQKNARFSGDSGPFFSAVFMGVVFYIAGTLTSVFLGRLLFSLEGIGLAVGAGLMTIGIYLSTLLAYVFSRTRIANYVISQSSIGEIDFSSTMSWGSMSKIYLTNAIAILFTLGLATPWAIIRTLKYRLSCLTIRCRSDKNFDEFIRTEFKNEGATADVALELYDFDLGF